MVCKPSGKNSFGPTICFLVSIFGVFFVGHQALSDPHRWWTVVFFLVLGVVCFFMSRYQFFGEEHLCVEGDDFIIHYVKGFPFLRDKRIPLSEIAELRYNQKSKAQELGEAISEFQGRAVNEDGIYLATKSGKVYLFGKDLKERQVEAFICRLEEYMMTDERNEKLKGEN